MSGLVLSGRRSLLINLGRRRNFAVTQILQDFEDFAPRGELSSAAAFVKVHGLHELDLFLRVVAFAGGRVDLASAFDLVAAIALSLLLSGESRGRWRAPLETGGGRYVAAAVAAAIDRQLIFRSGVRIIKRASFASNSRLNYSREN